MKLNIKSIFQLGLTILIFVSTSCNSRQSDKTMQKENKGSSHTKKTDYELAEEFLIKLKIEKTDTILFYKRVCIGCCNFFKIFWSAKGQKHLTKFYFDFDNMQAHSKTIVLANAKIFDVLGNNFNELKKNSIKGNIHKNKDGTSSLSILDHYCYAQISIYTNQDSVITDRIKDHDFDEYTDFGLDISIKNKKLQTNDNYLENINSKWNLLLTTIEREIAAMPEIKERELETLRTRKSEK